MQLNRLCGALFSVGILSAPSAGIAQSASLPRLVSPAFAAGALDASVPITLVFDTLPAGATVHLKLGVADLTGLLRQVTPLEYLYPANEVPLAAGNGELVVLLLTAAGELQEIKRVAVKVSGPAKARGAEEGLRWGPFTPKLDVSAPIAWNRTETTAADGAQTNERTTTRSIGIQTGGRLDSPLAGGTLTGNVQVVGNSDRAQALRYNVARDDAEKIDLAAYALEWKDEKTAAGIGNASFSGQHPLLWQSNNRGAYVTQKLGSYFDIGVAAQNATPIVGLPNTLGIYDPDHHFAAAVVGLELNPERPKALRVELFMVDAAQSSANPPPPPPDPNSDPLGKSTLRPCKDAFEVQQVIATGNTTTCDTNVAPGSQSQSGAFQSSKSRGFGARMLASNTDQSLRADLAWANSRSEDLANSTTPGTSASNQRAWQADLGYDIVKDYKLTDQLPLGISTTAKMEYSDPFYKSLAGSWQSDYRQSTVVFNINVGGFNASYNDMRRMDNVDHDPTRMRNRIDSQNLTLSAPFGQLLATRDAGSDPLLPTLSVNTLRMKMHADEVPATIKPDTVPNTVTTTYGATLGWTFERWTASYGITRSLQDNQQIGSENKDQKTITHTINGTWRPTDSWNLNINFAPSRMTALDTGIVTTRSPIQIGVNFSDPGAPDGWTLSGNVNYERTHDSADHESGKTYGITASVGRKFTVPAPWGKPLSGQIQLRLARNFADTRSTDAATLVASDTRQKSSVVMLDFSLSLF